MNQCYRPNKPWRIFAILEKLTLSSARKWLKGIPDVGGGGKVHVLPFHVPPEDAHAVAGSGLLGGGGVVVELTHAVPFQY